MGILNECNVISALLLNFLEPLRFFIELTLKLVAHVLQLHHLVSLSAHQHLKFFPLNVNVSSLLLGLFFVGTTLLKHIDELFEVSRSQLFRAVFIDSVSVGALQFFKLASLLHCVVVVGDHLRCAFAPLGRVEIVKHVIRIFFDGAQQV